MGKMGLSPQRKWLKGFSPTLVCAVALTFYACDATIVLPEGTGISPAAPASRIAFAALSPSSFNAGVVSTSSVSVTVQDSAQNAVTTFSGPVTLALYSSASCTGTPAATIVSGGTATASSGVATFSSVNIGGTAGTYYLGVSGDSVTGCSGAISLVPGTKSKLVYSTSPTANAPINAAYVIQPVVQIEDQYGNLITGATDSVTLDVYANSSCTGSAVTSVASIPGPITANAAAGVASLQGAFYFPGFTNYYVGATDGSLTPACAFVTIGGAPTLSQGNQNVHSCGVSAAGYSYCWGEDNDGQLGNNNFSGGEANSPLEVAGVGGTGVLSNITSISIGAFQTCALNSSGVVYCWGQDYEGELGINSTTASVTPVEVYGTAGTSSSTLPPIVSLSAGDDSTCAVSSAGNIYCWGLGTSGQLGNNLGSNSYYPVEVLSTSGTGALSSMASVSVGGSVFSSPTTCAVSSAGNVYCWGGGTYGTLGNGSSTQANVPVEVETGAQANGSGYLSNIASVTVGQSYACAVTSIVDGGNVFCWGYDEGQGNLGTNGNGLSTCSFYSCAPTPLEVVSTSGTGALSNIVSVSAAGASTCAIDSSNNTYCWGFNNNGQLGNNTTTTALYPVRVGVAGNYQSGTSISTGYQNSCVATSSGNVYCWGTNNNGDLGNGTSSTNSEVPAEVLGLGGSGYLSGIAVIGQSSGGAQAMANCAVTSIVSGVGGNVYCWGSNNNEQLGVVPVNSEETPVQTLGVGGTGDLSNVVSVSTGADFSCALTSAGYVDCWGINTHGGLGNNSTTASSEPVEVLQGAESGTGGLLSGIVSLSAGDFSACAVNTSGNVYCWGYNHDDELGIGNTTVEETPVEVKTASATYLGTSTASVLSVSAGDEYACAVTSAGTIYCWGENNDGQLGIGSNSSTATGYATEVKTSSTPTYLTNAVSVSAGYNSTCAVSSAGNVYCWGENTTGELGNNTTTFTASVDDYAAEVVGVGGSGNLSNIVSVAVSGASGGSATCALSLAGNVYCWGLNASGQLGVGNTTTEPAPVEVVTGAQANGSGYLSNIISISSAQSSFCALDLSGGVWCWGSNADGQLGNNSTTMESAPVEVQAVGGGGGLSL